MCRENSQGELRAVVSLAAQMFLPSGAHFPDGRPLPQKGLAGLVMRVVFGFSQVGLLHCQVPEQRNLLEGNITLPISHPMVVCSCSNTAEL